MGKKYYLLISLFILSLCFSQRPYRGAEYRTIDTFLYGRFEIRMKSAYGSGTVSSFFSINDYWSEGLSGTENWQEIDFEALGQYTNQFQTNVITAYETSHEQLHTLQYNPHVSFQTYAFEWTPDHIDFFINDQLIRRDANSYVESFNDGQKIMMNIWQPIWEDWVGGFDPSILPIYAFYDWVRYSSFTPGTGNTGTDNNFSVQWVDNFDYFNQERWQKATHTWNGNNSQFVQQNAVLQDGYLILCLTDNMSYGYSGEPLSINIDEKKEKSFGDLYIYPNPFNSTFKIELLSNIKSDDLIQIRLINIKGEVVLSLGEEYFKNNVYTFSVDKLNLSSGLYFGNIKTNKKNYNFKITYIQ